jgi:hypothetical protein
MRTALKYMIDDKGQKTSVLIPIKTWDKINEDYKKMQKKIKLITGIRKALAEIKSNKKSGKSFQSLKEFLSESNS